MTAATRAHLIISGLVQGVFFRHHTRKNAIRLDLTGWVRNRPDGNVEAVFEGTEENVALMIDWCRTGPPSARVTDVEITREEATHSFSDFTSRYD